MAKRLDFTNEKFGEITVLEYDSEISQQKKRSYWKCKCSCGNIKSIRVDVLKNIQTCGECSGTRNLIGKKFGRLTVLKKCGVDKNRHTIWLCQCDCGNTKEVLGTHLVSNKVQSCGCLLLERVKQPRPKNVHDLTNQRFGKLIAKSYTIENGHAKWLCQCDCGNTIEVYGTNLISNQTCSCGCMKRTSYGETVIQEYLQQNNITFQREYSFKDLRLKLPLRFDFAIFQNNKLFCLIEFQGIQHYEKQNNGWGDVQRNITDSMKVDYCNKLNIPLYIIKYDEDIVTRLNNIFQ